jgi:hypothetical protein
MQDIKSQINGRNKIKFDKVVTILIGATHIYLLVKLNELNL